METERGVWKGENKKRKEVGKRESGSSKRKEIKYEKDRIGREIR